MPFWVAILIAALVAISSYNFGHKNGLKAAPEAVDLEKTRIEAEVEGERLRVLGLQRSAPDPYLCLPIVLDGSLDLDEFCRNYLSDAEIAEDKAQDAMNREREQDMGR